MFRFGEKAKAFTLVLQLDLYSAISYSLEVLDSNVCEDAINSIKFINRMAAIETVELESTIHTIFIQL